MRGYLSARSIVMQDTDNMKEEAFLGVPLIEIPSRKHIETTVKDLVATVHDEASEVWDHADKEARYTLVGNVEYDRRMTATVIIPSHDERHLYQGMLTYLNSVSCSSAETTNSDGQISVIFGFSTEDDRDDAASECLEKFKRRPTCHRELSHELFHMLPLQTWINVLLKTYVRDSWEPAKRKATINIVLWGDQRSNSGNTSFRVRFLDKSREPNLILKRRCSPVYHLAITPQHEGDAVKNYLLRILRNATEGRSDVITPRLRFITGLSFFHFIFYLIHLLSPSGDHQFLWYITGIPGGSSEFRSIWTVHPANTFEFLAYGGTGDSTVAFFTVQDFLDGHNHVTALKERLIQNYVPSGKKAHISKKAQITKKIDDKIDRLVWRMWGAFRQPLVFQAVDYNWEKVLLVPPVMHNLGHLAINILQMLVQKYSSCKALKRIVGLLVNSQNIIKVHGTFAAARSKLSQVANFMHSSPLFEDFDRKVVELASTLCRIIYSVSSADKVYSLQLWVYGFLVWLLLCLNPVIMEKKETRLSANVYIQVCTFIFLSFCHFNIFFSPGRCRGDTSSGCQIRGATP